MYSLFEEYFDQKEEEEGEIYPSFQVNLEELGMPSERFRPNTEDSVQQFLLNNKNPCQRRGIVQCVPAFKGGDDDDAVYPTNPTEYLRQ